jgi:hypothetical protein
MMPAKKAAKQPKPNADSAPKEKAKEQSLEDSFNQMQQMALDGFKAIESNLREIQQLFTDFEGRVSDLSNRVNRLEGGSEPPAPVPPSKEGTDDLQKRLREAGKKIGQKLREIQGEGLSTKKGI